LNFTEVLAIKADEENIDHLSQIVESHSAFIGHPLGQLRL
jgi:hypothetical protein